MKRGYLNGKVMELHLIDSNLFLGGLASLSLAFGVKTPFLICFPYWVGARLQCMRVAMLRTGSMSRRFGRWVRMFSRLKAFRSWLQEKGKVIYSGTLMQRESKHAPKNWKSTPENPIYYACFYHFRDARDIQRLYIEYIDPNSVWLFMWYTIGEIALFEPSENTREVNEKNIRTGTWLSPCFSPDPRFSQCVEAIFPYVKFPKVS